MVSIPLVEKLEREVSARSRFAQIFMAEIFKVDTAQAAKGVEFDESEQWEQGLKQNCTPQRAAEGE